MGEEIYVSKKGNKIYIFECKAIIYKEEIGKILKQINRKMTLEANILSTLLSQSL